MGGEEVAEKKKKRESEKNRPVVGRTRKVRVADDLLMPVGG